MDGRAIFWGSEEHAPPREILHFSILSVDYARFYRIEISVEK